MPLGIERLAKIPNTISWNIRQMGPHQFRAVNKKDQLLYYAITSKTATTNAHYIMKKHDEEIGEIIQDKILNQYDLLVKKEKIAVLKVSTNLIDLEYSKKLKCKPELRAKMFDFIDENNNITLTVDKKSLTMKDKYEITHKNDFSEVIAVMITIALDDSFHGGLTS